MTNSMTKLMTSALVGVFATVMIFGLPEIAVADDEATLARGGKIYDKWYKIAGAKAPKASHPLYPAAKKYAKKPKSNWRCKECHGWDYMGKDGAYASGKHSTGIKGVNGMAGTPVEKIVAVLKGDHAYAGKMPENDMKAVALFVSKGQIDMRKYIDYATKTPKGDKAKGANYFGTICSGCHGMNGDKPKDMGKTLGKQMSNPQEVFHKVLNGHPGEPMPGLRALDHQIGADILAHIATLPKKR
ncbi:MAG: hypothetical protein HN578_11250 [Rhodospirillales bacterium]|jgi:mono/diheme cytochrome c family protein|nr:hypothetical protein [Rhodospirillaceae bacterium]MBT8003482.1 hypothetical protein [Rhodospirillales bacterium]